MAFKYVELTSKRQPSMKQIRNQTREPRKKVFLTNAYFFFLLREYLGQAFGVKQTSLISEEMTDGTCFLPCSVGSRLLQLAKSVATLRAVIVSIFERSMVVEYSSRTSQRLCMYHVPSSGFLHEKKPTNGKAVLRYRLI